MNLSCLTESIFSNILYFSWQAFKFLLVYRNTIYTALTNSSETLLSSLLGGTYVKEYPHALNLYTPASQPDMHRQAGKQLQHFGGRDESPKGASVLSFAIT